MYIYVCVYIYIYVCIYTYIYIYIYIYTHASYTTNFNSPLYPPVVKRGAMENPPFTRAVLAPHLENHPTNRMIALHNHTSSVYEQ